MTVTWPTTPDTLPKPLSNTKRNAAGFELDVVITDHSTLLERLESVASGQLFINGNYDVWQRIEGGSQTCTTTFNAITSFGPDRMYTLPAGASVTVARSTTLPDARSRFSSSITGAASVTTVDHGQRIRSAYRTLYKQSLIFSAYIRNESGAAFAPLFRIDTPGAADDWTTPTNRFSTSLQSCADAAWTQVWTVVDPSSLTNTDNGMSVYIRVPSGSLVAGDVVRVAQMSLRPGVGLVPYLPPDPEIERWRCLPYYRKSYSDGTALQTNTIVGLAGGGIQGSGGTNVYANTSLDPPTWKIPTIRYWGKAGTANQFWNPVTAADANTVSLVGASTTSFNSLNSGTASEIMQFHYDAVAEAT
jgi:hypothetical protein